MARKSKQFMFSVVLPEELRNRLNRYADRYVQKNPGTFRHRVMAIIVRDMILRELDRLESEDKPL